ncbi:MAG: rhodanese-like domain-containing protein [Candidatus Stygibacter australis]|nr:rhodanese-like domain-containing protein [Candidatus Stygibacter australis]MDP8323493.1 rhodanese-like domain-containing protein [Candidatus Stygibacter australis]
MKKGILILLIALISVMMMVSCSKDDEDNNVEPTESNFEILVNYMNSNGMTIDELLTGWIVAPDSTLYANIGDYYVMDLRSADYKPANGVPDYDDGHIEGAVLTSSATIIADAAAADGKPIIVVCWTGQSAGFSVMALRLSGYDAKLLKYGMSGWHTDFDLWSGNINTIDSENWVAAPGDIAEDMIYEMPDLVADGETGEEILAERIDAMLAGGFKGVKAINDGAGVLEVPENFFINNYWAADDVVLYGNIVGSHRIKPLVLENLDPDEQIVTYCWTSMTSSLVSAYLIVLGYDAASLRFGVNGMIFDNLAVEKQWPGSADLTYVPTR